jgi:hypothetical protein
MMVEMQRRMNECALFLMLSNVGIDSINNPTFENISNLKKCLIIKTPKRFFCEMLQKDDTY